jgi:hypothetical protein
MAGAAVIAKERVFESLPTLFVTVIVALKLPYSVGAPEITPLALFMLRPAGKPVTAKVGAGTPVAVTVVVYELPLLPFGNTVVVIAGAERTVRPKLAVSEPNELVALTFTMNVPSSLGVPEMVPVELFMLSPAGRPVAVNVGTGAPSAATVVE